MKRGQGQRNLDCTIQPSKPDRERSSHWSRRAARGLLWLTFVARLTAGADVTTLPRDYTKEGWARAALARFGLANDIRVVRDDSLTATDTCAFAIIRNGIQWIAYDPQCVTTLTPGEANYWWSAGVMLHEISHHLGAHMTASVAKSSIDHELDAERWVGWAFRHLGATLPQSLIYAHRGPMTASSTHPGRTDRTKAVERGWREADALIAAAGTPGRMPMERLLEHAPNEPPAANSASVPGAEALANAARRHLRALRKKTAGR